MNIERLVEASGGISPPARTRPLKHRLAALTSLERAILRHEDDLNEALRQDLKKSPFELICVKPVWCSASCALCGNTCLLI